MVGRLLKHIAICRAKLLMANRLETLLITSRLTDNGKRFPMSETELFALPRS